MPPGTPVGYSRHCSRTTRRSKAPGDWRTPNPGGPLPSGASRSVMDCGSPLPLSIPAGRASKNSAPLPRTTRRSKAPGDWRTPNPGGPLRRGASRSDMDCRSPLPLSIPAGRASKNSAPLPRTTRRSKAPGDWRTPNPGGPLRPDASRSVMDCGSPLPLSIPAGRASKNSAPLPRTTRRSKAPGDWRTPNPGGPLRPGASRGVMDCGSPLPLSIPAGRASKNSTPLPRPTRRSKAPGDWRAPNPGGPLPSGASRSDMDCRSPPAAFNPAGTRFRPDDSAGRLP